jgi:tryptophan synthase beta chain
MVRVSFDQKPFRKTIMKIYGADVFASPSPETEFGKKVLEADLNSPGSLGIAISEALETVGKYQNAKYALGSVLNHVILHQTVVGQEAKKQMEIAGEYPDVIIGCVGGGSNFGGFAIPFLIDKISGAKKSLKAIGVESTACPKMTKGEYRYDHGDSAQMTPLLKMETLGSDFIPPKIHAGGLRYHGNAPLLSFLNQHEITESRAYSEEEVFKAGILFARSEGIVPAPESSHAIQATVEEAEKCKESGEKKVILINLSGHGLLDLKGYEQYLV